MYCRIQLIRYPGIKSLTTLKSSTIHPRSNLLRSDFVCVKKQNRIECLFFSVRKIILYLWRCTIRDGVCAHGISIILHSNVAISLEFLYDILLTFQCVFIRLINGGGDGVDDPLD